MILRGRWVRLRPLRPRDAAMTLAWRLGPHARLLNQDRRTVSGQRRWIEARRRAGDVNFVIECPRGPVGMLSMLELDLRHRRVVGGRFLIGDPLKARGYPVAFEADLLLGDYVFRRRRLRKIHGDMLEGNPSLAWRLKLGWKVDGLLRDHYFHRGAYRNAVALSLLAEDYRRVCRPRLLRMISLFGPPPSRRVRSAGPVRSPAGPMPRTARPRKRRA